VVGYQPARNVNAFWPAEHIGRVAAQIINRQQPERRGQLGDVRAAE
jgi:hypothetical protein